MTTIDPKDRLWAKEAATHLRVSRSTLAKWRMRNEGPPFYRCGRRLVYYHKSEIDSWLIACGGSQVRGQRQ